MMSHRISLYSKEVNYITDGHDVTQDIFIQ